MRSQVFHDFDAFAASVKGVESKMMLRNPKNRVWSTSLVSVGDIEVQVGKLGSGNIAQGESRPDGHMLYLPLTDGIEYTANGRVLEEGAFAILEPSSEFCISTRDKHDWCVASIPNHMFAAAELNEKSSHACYASRPFQQAAQRFRKAVLQIMAAAANCSSFESSPAATNAATELLGISSAVLGNGQPVEPGFEGRPRVSRKDILEQSVAWIEQSGGAISVREMAAAAGVSDRTLRTAFNEYFGVGPVRYFQLRQLHDVHRALKSADPEFSKVSEILIEHGEWAFSRFASRYRKLFGERPSETLRANKR